MEGTFISTPTVAKLSAVSSVILLLELSPYLSFQIYPKVKPQISTPETTKQPEILLQEETDSF
jgi:hypothetical protein